MLRTPRCGARAARTKRQRRQDIVGGFAIGFIYYGLQQSSKL